MNRTNDTTIQFSGLKSGCYDYDFELSDSFFDTYNNDEIAGATVHYGVILDKKEHTLLLKFNFSGTVTTTCDRCLGSLVIPVEGEETLCVKFGDAGVSESDDTVILPESATEIDLAQWMYEYVAVRIPLQHSHAEGSCDPAMMAFISDGESGQVEPAELDPRWDALLQLKDEKIK